MSGSAMMSELRDLFVLGRDMPAELWRQHLEKRAFQALANGLVWQADGTRFLPQDGFIPEGAVGLAHPVELDAEEILFWRRTLKARGIAQPFPQMWESVVLREGRLPGGVCSVESAGETWQMLDRYQSYCLPFAAIPSLEDEGFRFIVRRRWDEKGWRWAEIQVVNVVTPAGILYECRPDAKVETLREDGDLALNLGLFYPFDGSRLRTLNHAAAVLERQLIPEMLEWDALDMLLPHLAAMPSADLEKLRGLCPEEGETARLLQRLAARKEGDQP